MYVTFLFFTPVLLSAAVRFGWRRILFASGCIWALAQFGLRDLVHNWIVSFTHLQIPLQETGPSTCSRGKPFGRSDSGSARDPQRAVKLSASPRAGSPPWPAACASSSSQFGGVGSGRI